MNRTKYAMCIALAAILFVGAGCAKTQGTEKATEPAVSLEDITKLLGGQPESSLPEPLEASNGLLLTAEPQGGEAIKLSWKLSKELSGANRFIAIRDDQKNPEHNGKNYWARFYYTKRETVWGGQPAGLRHYRICLTENNENDKCVMYSNDVAVEVK